MAQQVSDYVLERLTEWGVHRIFGYPGDGINAFLGAFDRAEGDPEFIQVRHEEMSAFMACAHAKFTGEIGVCIATSGPGAIHLLNGLYDAKLDHQPVLALIGQQKRMSLGAHYQQEVDLSTLFKDVSEFVNTCTHPAQARHLIDRGIRTALGERGVATIIFPADVQEEEAQEAPPRTHGAVYSSVGYLEPRVIPKTEDLQRAADILNQGEKVAMLIGQGAIGAADEVVETAELLGAGVAKALLGRAALPDDLPFVTGPIGLLGSTPSYELMKGCDTLLMVGTSFPYSEWLPEEGQAKCVEIDIDPRMIGIRYPADVPLVGDARETLKELIPLLRRKEDRSWREQVEENVRDWWQVVEEVSMQQDGDFMNPQRVVWELNQHLSEDAIICADSGSSTNWFARQLKLKKGNLASLSGTLATMGPARPVRDRGQVRIPGAAGDRVRRRRRLPDERDERAPDRQEVLGAVLEGASGARLLRLQQPGPEPGDVGAARALRRPTLPGNATDPRFPRREVRRADRPGRNPLRRRRRRLGRLARGAARRAALRARGRRRPRGAAAAAAHQARHGEEDGDGPDRR